MSETDRWGSISPSSIRSLFPKSVNSSRMRMKSALRKSRLNDENAPPLNPNIQSDATMDSQSMYKQSDSKIAVVIQKKEEDISLETNAPPSYPPLKVVVRIRPYIGRETFDSRINKVSDYSVCIGERQFSFDSVFDSESSQEDIFQSLGVPLVKNALAGYNTTILACGQSGSGKTYTMWGPPSAMVEANSANARQGIVPRIFQMLFSEIQREQANSDGKHINYQCRCSFLEIYNEQIGDLLDPSQRDLEIKDDAKNGFYVENLTEEHVNSYEDITQILIKGLSSRKIGATSINSKSSRSHLVFTCIIESWCKATSSTCFGSSKSSRITLVDLASVERKKQDHADKQCTREDKYIKKSISRLGYVVSHISKRPHTGKTEGVPYRSSCLTHLLKESLGGNAKLAVLCAISPDNKFEDETISTLRFGQLAKSMRNVPVINEITEDDVNYLTDQIRQLKEELIREKSNQYKSNGISQSYFKGRCVRESLNQLRVSLNRSLILPRIDCDHDEDIMDTGNDDVEELRLQLDKLHGSLEENLKHTPEIKSSIHSSSLEECCETELTSENYISCAASENEDNISEESNTQFHTSLDSLEGLPIIPSTAVSPCLRSSSLRDPPLSESPKIRNNHRKNLTISSTQLTSKDNMLGSSNFSSDAIRHSVKQAGLRSSLRSSKIFSGPTESLAASLQRGLQIIDNHQKSVTSSKSLVDLSFDHLTLKPPSSVDAFSQRKVEVEDNSKDPERDLVEALKREQELKHICQEQASKIGQLNHMVERYKHKVEQYENSVKNKGCPSLKDENKLQLLGWINNENKKTQLIKDNCEIEVQDEVHQEKYTSTWFDINEKEKLLKEIDFLRSKQQSCTDVSPSKSITRLRSSSLLLQSIQMRKSVCHSTGNKEEDLESERQRWMEMESEWISLTDELRIDLESNRQCAEKMEMELKLEKKCTEELDDALKRAMLGHARMVEHYTEVQEKYNDLVEKHRLTMASINDIKRAAMKAGAKGNGSRFTKSLAAELSVLRLEKEKERDLLKKENKSLRIQLRDTAEAVHAAGELLARLREAQEAASLAEENLAKAQEDNEKLRKQIEKVKRKHKMEMITMKQYLAESRLPEAALRPVMYTDDSDVASHDTSQVLPHDDQAWRAEFGPIYQEHY